MDRIPTMRSSLLNNLKGGRHLEGMSISTLLEAEILACLVGKERMVSELTEEIYGVARQNPNYHTYYMKVSRTIKTLQRNGYVTTRLLGRDKPYRLTPYAASKIINPDEKAQRLIPVLDAITYLATVVFGLVNLAAVFSSTSSSWLSTPGTILPYTIFLVLSGYSLARLSTAARKVS